MRNKVIVLTALLLALASVVNAQAARPANPAFAKLLDDYFKERMRLLPLEATANGQPGNNDQLPAEFTDSYRARLRAFFSRYLGSLQKFNRNTLIPNDQISLDVLKREVQMSIEGIDLGYFAGDYPLNRLTPFDQKNSDPLLIGQYGSGESQQPFKTFKDYQNWEKRAGAFVAWTDSAIVYFRKGIAAGVVLPQALVVKMIPQMESFLVSDPTTSLFYGPIKKFPESFSDAQKKQLTAEYVALITQKLIPAYRKLADFLKTEYLPSSRKTTGISDVPHGEKQYKWLIRYWTTTNKPADEIYETGLNEVNRIKHLMDSVRQSVGFTGELKTFFSYMKTDKQFMPFKTTEEVLNAYRSVLQRIQPNLSRMFNHVPKTRFEVRQTEAFRAASANAQYYAGLPDGSRPGVFYIPILDATKYNVTTSIDGLFLHEAIPGHHYQVSLQNENESLPKFRRFLFYGAYGEGWGLYAESLGKELGVYTDPYQYVAALGQEIFRAIRLVVDVGIHSKHWTREQAIQYMMDNMPIDVQRATSEVERYMSIPAQALSYKIGSMKIQELRSRYEKMLGSKFNLAAFHDEVLGDGGLPLEVLERKMEAWANKKSTNNSK